MIDLIGYHKLHHYLSILQASTRSVFGQRSDNNVELDENAARRPINPYGVSKVAVQMLWLTATRTCTT
jgi:UDP-glucose 4-epimerase